MGNADLTIGAFLSKLPDDNRAGPRESALRQLGWALVAEGQLFLQANSDEYDVDLFFETYGHPRREEPAHWVERITTGLQDRLTSEQWKGIEARAVDRAAAKIRSEDGTSAGP